MVINWVILKLMVINWVTDLVILTVKHLVTGSD